MLERTEIPLITFKSQEQLDRYVEYWKTVLHMQDWIIVARVVHPTEFDGDPNLCGQISMRHEDRCAYIKLIHPEDYPSSCVIRMCAEKTLVHELLHCKMNTLVSTDTYEGRMLDVLEHRLLDEMAESLIMARYGVTRDWFLNREYWG